MLILRRTPTTSTVARWLPGSTTSTTCPGIARHTAVRSLRSGRMLWWSRRRYITALRRAVRACNTDYGKADYRPGLPAGSMLALAAVPVSDSVGWGTAVSLERLRTVRRELG